MILSSLKSSCVLLLAVAFAATLALLPANAANNEAVGRALEKLMKSENVKTGSERTDADFDKLREFYRTRSFKPVWSRDSGPKGKAKALVAELSSSAVHGLSSSFYGIKEIKKLMGSKKPDDLARLDMLLSGALTDFGYDLVNGRISGTAGGEWNRVKPIEINPAELVSGAADGGNLRSYVSKIVQPDFRYVRLIAKIAEFKRLEQSNYWPKTKLGSRTIGKGKADKRIAAVSRILTVSGDLSPNDISGTNVLGNKLSAALVRYQTRHGLPATGVVDKSTLHELSQPIASKIIKMQLNLERRRWENRVLDGNSIYLNLADGAAKISKSGKTQAVIKIAQANELASTPTQYGHVTGVRLANAKTVALVFQPLQDGLSPIEIPVSGSTDDALSALSKITNKEAVKLKSDLEAADGKRLKLSEPIAMFITYITAWANRDGSINFRQDKLARDQRLQKLLKL